MRWINKISLMLISILLTSCGVTHIEFNINWYNVWEIVGYMSLGAFIVVIILLWLFKDFKVW